MEQRNHAFADAADTLLVMEAPGGEIESFDILSLQGRTSEEADKLLSRSLNRFCAIADQDEDDFVPDNHLRVYDCGADAHLENHFWRFTTDPDAIGNYIDARNLTPYMDVPLRRHIMFIWAVTGFVTSRRYKYPPIPSLRLWKSVLMSILKAGVCSTATGPAYILSRA